MRGVYDSWYNNMYAYMINPNPDTGVRFDVRYKELLDSGLDSKTAYKQIMLELKPQIGR